jgi:hypothetical protein
MKLNALKPRGVCVVEKIMVAGALKKRLADTAFAQSIELHS